MTTTTRKKFVSGHADKSIDLRKLPENAEAKQALRKARLGVEKLATADLNKDGSIAGAQEMSALFSGVAGDFFEGGGSTAETIVLDRDGKATTPGKILKALAPVFQSATGPEGAPPLKQGFQEISEQVASLLHQLEGELTSIEPREKEEARILNLMAAGRPLDPRKRNWTTFWSKEDIDQQRDRWRKLNDEAKFLRGDVEWLKKASALLSPTPRASDLREWLTGEGQRLTVRLTPIRGAIEEALTQARIPEAKGPVVGPPRPLSWRLLASGTLPPSMLKNLPEIIATAEPPGPLGTRTRTELASARSDWRYTPGGPRDENLVAFDSLNDILYPEQGFSRNRADDLDTFRTLIRSMEVGGGRLDEDFDWQALANWLRDEEYAPLLLRCAKASRGPARPVVLDGKKLDIPKLAGVPAIDTSREEAEYVPGIRPGAAGALRVGLGVPLFKNGHQRLFTYEVPFLARMDPSTHRTLYYNFMKGTFAEAPWGVDTRRKLSFSSITGFEQEFVLGYNPNPRRPSEAVRADPSDPEAKFQIPSLRSKGPTLSGYRDLGYGHRALLSDVIFAEESGKLPQNARLFLVGNSNANALHPFTVEELSKALKLGLLSPRALVVVCPKDWRNNDIPADFGAQAGEPLRAYVPTSPSPEPRGSGPNEASTDRGNVRPRGGA